MNPVPLFLIIVSLPLLLGGCGEKEVNDDEIEYREGVAYLKGSNRSYTGKIIGLNSRGEKRSESQLEKGKMISWIGWHDNGKKAGEENYQKGHSYRKYWNEKGEIVSSLGEALGSVSYDEGSFNNEGIYYVKPSEPVSVSPKLKYEIKGDAVTITGFDRKPSGELTIPATIEGKRVTSIGEFAFNYCTSLTSVTIPDSVTRIRKYAFSDCTSLTNITIPESVTEIEDCAFSECTSLTSVTISDSVIIIGFGVFVGCTSLTNITIPDNVTRIRDYTFESCRSLTSITIPDGVTSIEDYAFRYCSSLTNIRIPDSVTSIGGGAFDFCRALTAVTFLGDVPKVGKGVFAGLPPTIYRKPEAKGWGDTFAGRPVKLISEKP